VYVIHQGCFVGVLGFYLIGRAAFSSREISSSGFWIVRRNLPFEMATLAVI